jgi:hypothetical protein
MHAIRKKYTYNHVHDATLLQFILKELAGADSVRVLKDAPALGTGTVHLVTESVSYLQVMGEDTNSTYTKSAYGVSSDSDSSDDKRKPCTCERKKSQRSKSQGGRGKQKKEKDDEEYVPPLQKVPSQEAPSSRTGQVHVEQELQGPPLQIYLRQA